MTSTESADKDGTYGVALFPAVAGESSGTVTEIVTSSRCTLRVTFLWHL